MKSRLLLFFTGWLQVFLVSAQTYFLIAGNIIGIICFGYMISYIWTHNVKKVAFGGELDRQLYAAGACLGGVFGWLFAKLISG